MRFEYRFLKAKKYIAIDLKHSYTDKEVYELISFILKDVENLIFNPKLDELMKEGE